MTILVPKLLVFVSPGEINTFSEFTKENTVNGSTVFGILIQKLIYLIDHLNVFLNCNMETVQIYKK